MSAPERELVGLVRRRLTDSAGPTTAAAVIEAVRSQPEQTPLGATALLRLGERLYDEIAGAGPLGALLADPAVTDVVVNGPGEVWVDRGSGMVPAPVTFPDGEAVRRLAQRLAAACERRLDGASPYVDARLPDGTRLHAVLAPVAVRGPYLSLRTFRPRAFTVDELVACGTLDPDSAAIVTAVVRARLAYLITGGTGTGKTTLLSTLLGLVPASERIVAASVATEVSTPVPRWKTPVARRSASAGASRATSST